MAQLGPATAEIESTGASLAFITAEKRDRAVMNPLAYLREHPVPFPYLLDEDRSVTKGYGVYHRVGLDAVNIARPASFVVDREEIVRFVFVGSHQAESAPLEDLLERLRGLGK